MNLSTVLILLSHSFLVWAQSSIGNWTWVGGSTGLGQAGNYGTMRIASPSNQPGARQGHAMVMDSQRQQFFLFGGYVQSTAGMTKKRFEMVV